nr:hypothetical protein [Tanacetum cinerariifolium]
MAKSLSPDHVFNFSTDDPAHDLEDPKEEFEEEPEEEPDEVTEVHPLHHHHCESSSDSEFPPPVTTDRTMWMPPSVAPSKWGTIVCVFTPLTTPPGSVSRRMDTYDVDLSFVERDAIRTNDHVLAQEEENHRLRRRVDSLEARPSESIDVLAVYEESQPPRPQGPPDGPQ